jgi:hypothetical protein
MTGRTTSIPEDKILGTYRQLQDKFGEETPGQVLRQARIRES